MKSVKHLIVVLLILASVVILTKFVRPDSDLIFQVLILIFVCFFVFSLSVRRFSWARPFFTSKINLFTGKFRRRMESELSKEILLHKFNEVIKTTEFKAVYLDKSKGELLAISFPSWYSWGENIYIDLEEARGKTLVEFISVSFFGIYTWGKNEENIKKLIRQFEESLVI